MNIAKLNTVSLDDKTFIIKRGTSGGGSTPDTPSGGGDWHYFDVSNNNIQAQMTIMQYASVIKCSVEDLGGMSIVPLGTELLIPDIVKATTAIAIDYSIEMIVMGTKATMGQALPTAPWFEKFPEITKEQFYSLD